MVKASELSSAPSSALVTSNFVKHSTQCYAKYELSRADTDLDETTEAFTI